MRIFIFTALQLLCCINYSYAASSVWKIESAAQTLYLGGTIHLLKSSDYPLPPEYNQAFIKSNIVVFETDLGLLDTIKGKKLITNTLIAQDGRRLTDILSSPVLSTLQSKLADYNFTLAQFNPYKPAMAALSLQLAELARLGVDSEGIDAHYYQRSLAAGKKIIGLETLQQQATFISAMGEADPEAFISQTLAELQDIDQYYEQIVSAWRNGNLEDLNERLVKEYAENYPQQYQQLIVVRNNNWMPIIEDLLKRKDNAYVLVGLAHLVGKKGLLQQLEDKGFKVSQL